MKDEDFDAAILKLLNGGYETVPEVSKPRIEDGCLLESMQVIREAILEAFFSHYTEIYNPDGTLKVEIISSGLDIQKYLLDIIKKFPHMIAGEVFVEGNGLYMINSDLNKNTKSIVGFLEGQHITGTIKSYGIGPLISYNDFAATLQASRDAIESEESVTTVPGVWMMIHDATVCDESGQIQAQFDSVIVPMNYPTLEFSKIIRPEESILHKELDEESVVEGVHFMGDDALELFEDCEDELNFQISDGKSLQEARQRIQFSLDKYMKIIDKNRQLILSSPSIFTVEGEIIEFKKVPVYYKGTVPDFKNGIWSIMHEFITQEEDQEIIVSVIPGYIFSIEYSEKK